MQWHRIETCPEGQLVMTKIDDGDGERNEQKLLRSGNLFFAGDMYVYYRPTHWRPLTEVERLRSKNDAERKAIDQLERAYKELGTL